MINLALLKNYFLYGCGSKEEFDLVKEERDRFNYKVWKLVTTVFAAYFFVLFITTFSIEVVRANNVMDAILALCMLILMLFLRTIAKPGGKLLMPVIYSACFVLLAFGIMIGNVKSSENLAVTFHVILIALPLIVVDRPWRMGLLEFIMTVVFMVSSLLLKEEEIRDLDIYNAIMFALIGQFVNYYMVQTKINQFLATKKVEDASVIDELTGLHNRKGFEQDSLVFRKTMPKNNFVYVAFDVNGLKVANDTMGHSARDELLIGAADCIQRCFGSYGRAYRMGGDEFSAIIYVDENQLKEIQKDFEQTMLEWQGVQVKSLSISAGYVSSSEFSHISFSEMMAISDQRMYAQKEAHYKKTGVDRRGQQAAYVTLCALYSKILKVNLTEDSYQVINHKDFEGENLMNYEKLSEWLREFGVSGRVHPEDLETYLKQTEISYLRQYFRERKTAIIIVYRRKENGTYKRAVLEMIRTENYQDEDQQLYLYVRSIED